jgi:hypothetical protein
MPASDGLRWIKSSHSDDKDMCVEVALPPNRSVLVRDTKAGPTSPILRLPASEWQAFLTAVREGEFDVDR